ncbi:dual specificity mitogen-activated kinase kinase 1-like [Brachionus plicatilis]|uniref:Dual specificity mitogen-activated kinase kinase 1-like n=1 Tax=Brachionus plicatilis TaxID=10195 RepID=A0A3M7RSF2_BRAPC|nr:dual specificity mitogen-activated kinase kinase 1-like [Brachionus plicatilis]
MFEYQNHDMEREISSESGSIVQLVKQKQTNVPMAKKLIPLEVKPVIQSKILDELKVLQELKSPYLVEFYGAYASNEGINICMEYMDGGSMDLVLKKVNRVPENILGKIAESVLMGLYLIRESHDLNHNNLKPSNILVNTKGLIKISDIEVSVDLTKEKFIENLQPKCYYSPEKISGLSSKLNGDVWSLGLSLVEMAIGRYPIPVPSEDEIVNLFQNDPQGLSSRSEDASSIQSMTIFEILEYILNKPPPSLPKSCFSEEFLDFLDTCLRKEPSERGDLKSLLQHRFIQKYKNEPVDTVISWINKIKQSSQLFYI